MLPFTRSSTIRRAADLLAVVGLAVLSGGWSGTTIRHVAWRAVDFFPPDLAQQVRRNHRRYDAGIRRGLSAPPAWRAGEPGSLEAALLDQAKRCRDDLLRPIPLDDLVEELGVLAVRILDANDPLAVAHGDPREPDYAGAYQQYTDAVRGRLRLVYYGRDIDLTGTGGLHSAVSAIIARSRTLYPFVGDEFFRGGQLRDWHTFDDRSVAFGVAAVALSRGMSDLANFCQWIWRSGGGLVPPPPPTPAGHVGPTITVMLGGGFPERDKPNAGQSALPRRNLSLPPP
jgi:hypothetical protein